MVPLVRRRYHRYIATDEEVSGFSTKLFSYHSGLGLNQIEADRAAARDIREYLIPQLAGASTQLQKLNHIKASARAQALFWLFAGFIFSVAVSATIIVGTALLPAEGDQNAKTSHQVVAGSEQPDTAEPANSAAAAIHRRGGEVPVSAGAAAAVNSLAPVAPSADNSASERGAVNGVR